MSKKLIASALAALSMAVSGSASAIIVGGVDFGTPGTNHIETTTLAETYISGNGQELIGYGQINTVNGNLAYAGTDRLYFVFDNYFSNDYTTNSVDFSGGEVRVYLLPTFNLLNQSSLINIGLIEAGTLWATLSGHQLFPTNTTSPDTLRATGLLTGASLSFTGAGLLDINSVGTLADVYAYLNSNNISDLFNGFADMALTTSGNNDVLNTFDNTTNCQSDTAAPTVGQWCIAGSADLRGDTVIPEPGVLTLIGLGLLGLGATRRRKSSAV